MLESDWRFQVLARSATWRGKHLPPQRWSQLCARERWMRLLCGTMPPPSTAAHGAASWIASLAEHPARTSLSPGSAQDSEGAEAGSSGNSAASCAPSVPVSSSGRTSVEPRQRSHQSAALSLAPVIRAHGFDFPRVTWAPPTGGPGSSPSSSTWPTLRASMSENRTTTNAPSHGNGHGKTLAGESCDMMRGLWATPTVCGNYNRKGLSATSGDGLATQALTLGPLAPLTSKAGDGLLTAAQNSPRLSLNPAFVAWLMGWRWLLAGWGKSTSSACSETESFPSRRPRPSGHFGPISTDNEAA